MDKPSCAAEFPRELSIQLIPGARLRLAFKMLPGQGVVAQPVIRRLSQEDREFQKKVGYIVETLSQKIKNRLDACGSCL
jgi:hypothetical protein